MRNCSLLLLLLCFSKTKLPAQISTADTVWLQTKNLRVCLRNDGSLYAGPNEGAVQFRQETPQGDRWVTVVREAGPWYGGVDPARNLLLSVQTFEPRMTDFKAGLPGVPGSDKLWQVSYDQILQHLEDYADNAVVDQPIEAIFAWPGRGNRFSKSYNGFEIPEDFHPASLNFLDWNLNGIYDPDKGDYPIYAQPRGGRALYFPDQITTFFYHTDSSTLDWPAFGFPVSGAGYAHTYACSSSPLLENSVFFTWTWQHGGQERSDSCIIGYYLNPDVGNPADDYHGSDWNTYFAYNADSLYDAQFEDRAPVISLCTAQFPLDTFGWWADMRAMQVGPPSDWPPISFPQTPIEFYRYMSVNWRDGSPLSSPGDGYGGAKIEETIFPGNPFKPGKWTEVNENNEPGDRRALISWYYQSATPGMANQLGFFLTVHPKDVTANSDYSRFSNILFNLNLVASWVGGFAFTGVADPSCASWPGPNFKKFIVRIYPNPVSDILNIQVEGGTPGFIRLYDNFQRLVTEIKFPGSPNWWTSPLQLPVRHLPPGVYYLEAGSRESIHKLVHKVVILH